MVTLPHVPALTTVRIALPRGLRLRRPSKTVLLLTLAAVALAGTVAVNVAQSDAQPQRMAHLAELDAQLSLLGQDIAGAKLATGAADARAAELRVLIAEQNARFADTTGFIE
ncbi:hypothetical protein [Microbacterium sp.]|uniref:hypothetical protein n=1 Tax=Microbacterium sp. TaxID=51671 RepID=UPI003F71BDEF